MAYADQKAGGNRVVAIAIVAIIHVIIGYAFVSGLAYQYVKKAQEELNVIDVTEPPPPPEEVPPPPPPPESAAPPPPQTTVVVQQPIVRVPVPSPPIRTTDLIPDRQPTAPPTPPAPPSPPAPPAPPPPPAISKKAGPRGDIGRYFGEANYPPSAKRDGVEGRVRASLTIGPDGRVTGCDVTGSSGSRDLDDATCRGARRARFSPAQNESGQPVSSTYPLSVTWQLQN